MKIGVVADDITGANDIGSMFAKGGYRVHVYLWDSFDPACLEQDQPDVCIIDTNSRLDPPHIAYEKVYAATQQLQQAGCPRWFNKTCSVFRGNIGAEFDAMLDALQAEFALVVLGFPKNGRLTINSEHYVHGQRLQDSPFRDDPSHPMLQSNLIDILQAQTERKVGAIDQRVIAQGADALRQHIAELQGRCQYVILDVVDQAALRTIAQVVGDAQVLCGSSALAEELPAVWGAPVGSRAAEPLPALTNGGILCAAGSLTPQTAAQIEYLRTKNVPTMELATDQLFTDHTRTAETTRVVTFLIQQLSAGTHAVVYAANQPEAVVRTRAAGAQHGFTPTAVARRVEESLAEIVARTLARTGGQRLVIAGGETSGAICRRLGINGMRIWHEIQPGLPSCVTLTEPPRLLVLKSGSFGSADFLQQAINHLQQQPCDRHDGGL